jgi:hypothetical protein
MFERLTLLLVQSSWLFEMRAMYDSVLSFTLKMNAWPVVGLQASARLQPNKRQHLTYPSPPTTVTTMRAVAACVLFAGVVSAVDVYLHPASASGFASGFASSPEQASAAVSQHLGLEFAQALDDGSRVFVDEVGGFKNFVAQGQEDGLFLTLNKEYAEGASPCSSGTTCMLIRGPLSDVIPSSFAPSFQISTPPVESLSSAVSTYLHRAAQAFTTIYSSASAADLPMPRMLDVLSTSAVGDALLRELSALVAFLEDPEPSSGRFAALELTGLQPLADSYGRKSEQYIVAASLVKAMLESALARDNTRIALLTFSSAGADKREEDSRQPPAQSPIPKPTSVPIGGAAYTCFTSAQACSNATSSCTGRGSCVPRTRAGQECFVCGCATTKTPKGAIEYWAGEACQRKDVSQCVYIMTLPS